MKKRKLFCERGPVCYQISLHKEYLKRDNERIDCVSYAIFNEEWQKLRDSLNEKIHRR